MAGVPEPVVGRAREHLAAGAPQDADGSPDEADVDGTTGDGRLAAELAEVDLANTTPMEALELLDRLQRSAADGADDA